MTLVMAMSATTVNAQLISPEDTPSAIEPADLFMSILGSDYETAKAWAFENDVLKGDGETGDIRPTDCVRRAEVIKMLYKVLAVSEANSNAELFNDTFADQWYAPFVRMARERNTIQGYDDGSFRPGQCVNRAEALKIALLEFPNITPVSTPLTQYKDVSESEWYYPYVSYALGNDLVGIKHTYFGGNYLPGDPMQRQEFAELLYRLKTLQDNGLKSYDPAYGPKNLNEMALKTYNLKPEEFLPFETSLFTVLDTNNQSLTDMLNKFLIKSPAGTVEGLTELMLKDLADNLLPAYTGGYKLMYGVNQGSGFMPNQTYLLTIKDSAKLNTALSKLSTLSDYSEATLFGFKTFTSETKGLYFAYTNDVLAAWPSFGERYLALQRIKNGERNLLQNTSYTQYLSSLPTPNSGMIYVGDPEASVLLAVVPNTNGINLHYRVEGVDVSSGKAPYMYKNLPGNNLLMYGEHNGMFDILGMVDPQADDLVEALQDEGIVVTDGAWMNQGYAFLAQDTGTMIPAFSLYFDATGMLDKAQQDLDNMDAVFDEMIVMIQEDDPENTDLIVKDKVMVDGKELSRITFKINELPQEDLGELAMLPESFLTPLEFYYGVTSDNYVVFALYTGFNNVYGKVATVSENADVRLGMSNLAGYPNGLSYVSVTNMANYVDDLIADIETSIEPMPIEMKDSYNEFMDYLSPIKYLISAEKDFTDFAGGLMFVKID